MLTGSIGWAPAAQPIRHFTQAHVQRDWHKRTSRSDLDQEAVTRPVLSLLFFDRQTTWWQRGGMLPAIVVGKTSSRAAWNDGCAPSATKPANISWKFHPAGFGDLVVQPPTGRAPSERRLTRLRKRCTRGAFCAAAAPARARAQVDPHPSDW